MKKINMYIFAVTLNLIIQVYFIVEIVAQSYDLINLWNRLYLPLLFSATSFLFTYIIYTQSRVKSSNCLIYFLLAGSTTFLAASESGLGNVIAKVIFSITFLLTSYFFRRFIFEALVNKRIIKRRQAKSEVFYFSLLLFVIGLDISREFINNDTFSNISRTVSILYFVFNISLPMIKIIQLLLTKQKAQRSFLIWMLLIPTFAFGPFIFLHALPSVFGDPWIDPYLTALAFFAIPIGYTYLVVSKKLFNIKFVFNRLLYYSGLAFIPSLFITLILVSLVTQFSFANLLSVFIILFLFNILFLFLKEQFDFYFRDSLFRDKNNTLQMIERVVKKLSTIMNVRELENYIAKEIKRQFNNVHLTKITYNYDTNQVEYTQLIGDERSIDNHLKELIRKNEEEKYISYGNSLGLFLSKQGNFAFYLWIQKQDNDLAFSVREKSWLLIFLSYVRLVFENIKMNEKNAQQLVESKEQTSASLSRFLFHFAESERNRLAGDIHDTILQEQIYIYRKLNEMTDDSRELKEIQTLLKQVIDKTRQTSSELLPNSLSNQGLSHALIERLERFKQRASFHIDYEIDLGDEQFINQERRLVIYRVIEELLNNAIKHSEAKRVSVYAWQTAEQVFIDYLDDGKGFDVKETDNKQIGLRSIRARVKSVSGQIEFETEKPKHVKIYITIPR